MPIITAIGPQPQSSGTGPQGQGCPPGSMHGQTRIRIEQIVRMRVAGVSAEKICELLQIQAATLQYLLSKPEYKDAEEAYLLGHLSEMDKACAGKVEELRNGLRQAVPAALRGLVDAVTQRRDLRTMLVAAKEILDRDPDQTFRNHEAQNDGVATPHLPDAVLADAVANGDRVTGDIASTKKEIIQ